MMRLNTVITLAASAVFGALAIWLSKGWINDALDTQEGPTPDAFTAAFAPETPMPREDLVSVMVADKDLNFGDTLTEYDVRIVDMPEDLVPSGALTDLTDFGPDQGRTVVLSRMVYNEPVIAYKISGPGGRGSLSSMISPGMRAVSIQVDETTGVGGLIVPGDNVDIVLTRDQTPDGQTRSFITTVIAQNLHILGVNQNIDQDSADAEIATTVTVEATLAQSQAISLGADLGRLSLSLRPFGDLAPAQTKPVNVSALGGTPSRRRTPSARPQTAPANTAADRVVEVTVIRDDERQSVSVSPETSDASATEALAGGDL